MATGGYLLGAPTALDSSLSCSAGGAYTNGSSFDLGANSSPQAVRNVVQLSITGGVTDGYDVEVFVQWSDDNATWPDNGEGAVLKAFTNTTGGASLGYSEWLEMPEPKARYGRLQYKNNNATDAVTVTSKVAQHKLQSA